MKNQALFSSKDKSKKLKCRLLQLLFSALRVNFPLLLLLFHLTVGEYGNILTLLHSDSECRPSRHMRS